MSENVSNEMLKELIIGFRNEVRSMREEMREGFRNVEGRLSQLAQRIERIERRLELSEGS
jgi:hypothetical protein